MQKYQEDQARRVRRLDIASAVLLLVGTVCAILSYCLVKAEHIDPLVMIPAVIAATVGGSHLFQRKIVFDD